MLLKWFESVYKQNNFFFSLGVWLDPDPRKQQVAPESNINSIKGADSIGNCLVNNEHILFL